VVKHLPSKCEALNSNPILLPTPAKEKTAGQYDHPRMGTEAAPSRSKSPVMEPRLLLSDRSNHLMMGPESPQFQQDPGRT
jgi:hypothetical protein